MSNFTHLNEIFHIFSKTPVADGQTLASARNKSGHTVTTSDIWAEDIPAFFSAPTQNHIDNFATIAKDNDLCYDETKKSFLYFKDGKWNDRGKLEDGELLANYEASKLGYINNGTSNITESQAVVKYYENRYAVAINGNNNNKADGNGYTARIAKDESGKSFVPQFISSMDKIVNGNPSSYYEPVVNGGDVTEDIEDKNGTTKYIANNYAGIIQFHKEMDKTGDKLDGVTISAFEYIGKKLNDVIENLGNDDTSAFNYTVAESLPSPDATWKGWIYFVPSSKQENNNIYNEFICVDDKNGNWKWEQIGSTAITLPGTGDFIGIDENNNLYVKTSSVIEDNTETVPTTQAVYEHTSNTEIHLLNDISEANISDGQTAVGETMHGFVLSPNYNVRITKIRIVQTSFQGASWNKKFYLKIVDPETNREHISTSKIVHKLYGNYEIPIIDFMFSEFETPYLIKGREYKVTFHDDTTHAPVGLSVAYVEDRKINELNKHISVTTKKIDANGNISSIVEGTVNGGQYGINSFTKIGYAAYPSTKTSTNNHLFNHFIDVNNEIIDKLGNTTDNTAFQAGAFIGIDQDNAIYVKTSSEIEDNPETVPTSQQLYSHHIDNERHLSEDVTSNTSSQGQIEKGTVCYGVLLESDENILINDVVICQATNGNTSPVTNGYIIILDQEYNIYYKSNNFVHLGEGRIQASFNDATNPESVDNLPYLIKDKRYHIIFRSSSNRPLELNVALEENEQNFNTHIGHHIISYLDGADMIGYYPNTKFTTSDGKSHTPYGYKVFFSTAKPSNKHIVKLSDEFVNLYKNWEITKIRNKHDFSNDYENNTKILAYISGKLSGYIEDGFKMVDINRAIIGNSLFKNSTLVEFSGDDLNSLINGTDAFYNTQLRDFDGNLSCLMNGTQMFMNCSNLTTFNSALPSLTNGVRMFSGCTLLSEFETKLPNLSIANEMFKNNTSLTKVNTCLPNITQGQGMFMSCSALSNVRFSKNSFQCLYNGQDMFNGCSGLTEFHYELPYLETADDMFVDCKLDLESVRIIAESLYDFGTKDSNGYAQDGRKHVITFGVAEGVAAQAQDYKTLMENKGWIVEGLDYTPPSGGDDPDNPDPDNPNPDNPGGSGGENPDNPDDPDNPDNPDPDNPTEVSYDISETNPDEENPYIADISAWRKDRYEAYNLKITSIPYDGEENVGLMIGTVGKNN